jgi:putative redox protein
MKKPIHAKVVETHLGTYALSVNTNGHIINTDEPKAFGGDNLGPAPYDLLLAALGACTVATVRWYAKSKDWPLEHIEVELTHEKRAGKNNEPYDHFTKTVNITGPDLTPEQIARLKDVAAKCPVHKTLISPDVVIDTL